MWLSRLDLLAFGRFTDVRLTLGPAFNLVYGPNEAGKSTTLRAIRQLLFGFDERTLDNFVHPNPNLRVGGVVCDDTGVQREVIRRKTRKDSLRAADDVAMIDAAEWQKVLCDIDESTFSRRYGIDYQQLVDGGHEIATGCGDLGEILFATGSGVMDLTAVQKRLSDEATELFRPQGKRQRLNQAIVEWQSQRDLVVEKLLPVAAWEEADRLREDVKTRLKEISSQYNLRTADADRFRRWQQAWPLVREQDELKPKLVPVAHVPRLPQDFRSRRQQAVMLLDHANTQQRSATESLRQSRRELDRLVIPKTLLERADELMKLFAEWGSCHKANLDRAELVKQYEQRTAVVTELVQSLGRSLDDIAVDETVLDLAFRTRFGQLGRRQAVLVQSLEQAKLRGEQCRKQIDDVRTELETMPNPEPLDELKSLVSSTRNDGDLESQLGKIQNELATLEDEVKTQQQRLGLFAGSLNDLRSMEIPSVEIIRQFGTEFDSNQAEQSLLRSRADELHVAHQRLRQQILEIRTTHHVPTETDLDNARRTRQAEWQKIRDAVSSQSVPDLSTMVGFEKWMTEADCLADRLRNEADRVAQLVEYSAELVANESRQHEASDRLAELEATRIALEQRWQSEWPHLNESVRSPHEMQTWLARREILLAGDEMASRRKVEEVDLIKQISERTRSLLLSLKIDPPSRTAPAPSGLMHKSRRQLGEVLESAMAEQSPVLQQVTKRAGSRTKSSPAGGRSQQSILRQQKSFGWDEGTLTDSPNDRATKDASFVCNGYSLNELLQQAEDRLIHVDLMRKSRIEAEELLVRLTKEDIAISTQRDQAADELEKWQAAWKVAMTELNLPPDSSPDVAATYVETLSDLMDRRRQAAQLQCRISGIDADSQRFTASLQAVCREIAPDLASLETVDIVTQLRTRLLEGQRDQTLFNELTGRHTQSQRLLELAQESRIQAETLIEALCVEAGLTGTVDATLLENLAQIEEQSEQRREFDEQLTRVTSRLRELAGNEPLAEFEKDVRQQTLVEMNARRRELEQESARLATERDQLNRQLGASEEVLRRMDGGAEAAEAQEKQQQWLAQIRTDAEQYVRLKLASVVLHSAIERYRDKTREPVLTAASELFRELTLGSFEGLRVDEDDHNRPVLVGIRPGGREAVAVNGMSEGTCDQLYLALRLASLQLEKAPLCRLPFVVDDVLIQFDDARAGAALRVLSRLAQQRQVIFFTHHEHLLEIASKSMTSELSIHRLEISLEPNGI